MKNNRTTINMALTGLTGKKAAEALSEVFGKPNTYNSTFNQYETPDTFDRLWLIGRVENITCRQISNGREVGAGPLYAFSLQTPMLYPKDIELLEKAVMQLNQAGALTNDSTKLTIGTEIKEPRSNFLQNIENIMRSKGELLQKAIQSNNLPLTDFSTFQNNNIIHFPMFNSTLSIDHLKSYIQLVKGISNFAQSQNRISPTPNNSPNEKFTFRTWLIRLGMIGDEYKTARSVLMENLEGNSAWKNPEMAKSRVQIRSEPDYATNETTQDINTQADPVNAQLSQEECSIETEQYKEELDEPDEGMILSM